MSFFRNMNRKQKRAFDRLGKNEQLEIFTHELNKNVKAERNKAVSLAFIDGILCEADLLYDKYFEKWRNSTPSERDEVVKNLMEEIKKGHDKYVERHVKKEETNQESENE